MAYKKEFTYKILEHHAVLEGKNDVTMELNVVSFCDAPPKWDIRAWKTKGDERILMRGITLTDDGIDALARALNALGRGQK